MYLSTALVLTANRLARHLPAKDVPTRKYVLLPSRQHRIPIWTSYTKDSLRSSTRYWWVRPGSLSHWIGYLFHCFWLDLWPWRLLIDHWLLVTRSSLHCVKILRKKWIHIQFHGTHWSIPPLLSRCPQGMLITLSCRCSRGILITLSCRCSQGILITLSCRCSRGYFNHTVLQVLSGKGGVGKSTVSAQLARGLARDEDSQVALLDIDICGPSVPLIMGVQGEQVHHSGSGWSPIYVEENLAVMSVGFLLPRWVRHGGTQKT